AADGAATGRGAFVARRGGGHLGRDRAPPLDSDSAGDGERAPAAPLEREQRMPPLVRVAPRLRPGATAARARVAGVGPGRARGLVRRGARHDRALRGARGHVARGAAPGRSALGRRPPLVWVRPVPLVLEAWVPPPRDP